MEVSTMQYNYLGNTGLKVSAMCMGSMTFALEKGPGKMPGTSQSEAFEILDSFAEAGGNFIDTADMYAEGESEVIVGEWLQKKERSDFVLATKARWPTGDGPNKQGLSRKYLMDALDASLARLQTSYVDLYYLHAWDSGTPLKETLSTLNDFVRAGKVRYIGVANFAAWQLQKAIDLCEKYNYEPITCIQQQYSLLCRETEWEMMPCCVANGISLLPWSPLKGGWLTGRYTPNTPPPEDTRVGWAEAMQWIPTCYSANNTPHTYKVVEVLTQIAKKNGREPAQVALRWLLQRSAVPSVVVGARTLQQLQINIQAVNFQLSVEDMAALDRASEIGLPYPHNLELLYGSSRNR
jgi:aryl-alcohol dehydrogenase-like predicted oxidoreductase